MSQNTFGGKNPNSLYVPMSEVEQEVISRLVESGDLRIIVKTSNLSVKHQKVIQPFVRFGDLRLELKFRLDFTAPAVPSPIHFIDLELKTGAGILLFKERQNTMQGGNPIQVAEGVFIDLAWDIAIMNIDPKIVKKIKPKAVGLTSRFTDKDTGALTLFGNNEFTPQQKTLLVKLREGESQARKVNKERVLEAESRKIKQ